MQPIFWVPIRNADTVTLPRFALVEIQSIDEDGVALVARTTFASRNDLLYTGPLPLDPGDLGQGTRNDPGFAAYTGGTPVAGETWGVRYGECELKPGFAGYRILGGAAGGVVNVMRDPGYLFLPYPTGVSPDYAAAGYNVFVAASSTVAGLTITGGGFEFLCEIGAGLTMLELGVAPTTPPAGRSVLYFRAGAMYYKTPDGVEHLVPATPP